MKLKGLFSGRSGIFQIILLLSFILGGAILASIFSLLPLNIRNPDTLRLYQFISSVCMFLLPAFFVAYLCSQNPRKYLYLSNFPGLKVVFITFISMFLFSPVITLTGIFNKLIKLPSFMEVIERWMQSMEASAEQITQLLLSDTGWSSIAANLLVIALTAAITEEILFRGTLQRIIGKWTPNHHINIWLVAFIFSAIHMQFYGFIPRLLLGAYFGYLLYWSRSIWLPVLAHFINNAVAVIGMSNEDLKENVFISGEVPDSEIIYFIIPAIVSLILFSLCIQVLRKELKGPGIPGS